MAIIWNPTIRKSVDVVVPNVLHVRFNETIIGFGVCPRTLDPMLVKIYTESGSPHKIKINTTWLVKVLRLSSGILKSLSIGLPRRNIAVRENQVVLDRFIYWSVFDRFSGCHLILSFDMISEEFLEIRLPDSLLRVNVDSNTATGLSICNLKEYVVVLQFTCEMALRDLFGVWMMDNGDPKSFEKVYTINSNNMLDTPIIDIHAFRKNGEAIVTMTKLGVETFEY
ncbi:putative F-box domain-containing protein [Tanacetum coccineum]